MKCQKCLNKNQILSDIAVPCVCVCVDLSKNLPTGVCIRRFAPPSNGVVHVHTLVSIYDFESSSDRSFSCFSFYFPLLFFSGPFSCFTCSRFCSFDSWLGSSSDAPREITQQVPLAIEFKKQYKLRTYLAEICRLLWKLLFLKVNFIKMRIAQRKLSPTMFALTHCVGTN